MFSKEAAVAAALAAFEPPPPMGCCGVEGAGVLLGEVVFFSEMSCFLELAVGLVVLCVL